MDMNEEYQNAVAVTRDIHWVGFYDEAANLHCNPYLLVDEGEAVFIDPGSIPHFPMVMRKVIDLVNPQAISLVVAQHQDPDVCGNLAVVEDVVDRGDLRIAAHTNTIRLIRHLGVRSAFHPVDQEGFRLVLQSGRVLEFLFTPYLHSPGAICTYDTRTRSLFSSDLFGALSDHWSLFAKGDFLAPMDAFHQVYMPANQVLRPVMERLAGMRIDRILPQHGSILEGDQVDRAIAHLKELPCGMDLLAP